MRLIREATTAFKQEVIIEKNIPPSESNKETPVVAIEAVPSHQSILTSKLESIEEEEENEWYLTDNSEATIDTTIIDITCEKVTDTTGTNADNITIVDYKINITAENITTTPDFTNATDTNASTHTTTEQDSYTLIAEIPATTSSQTLEVSIIKSSPIVKKSSSPIVAASPKKPRRKLVISNSYDKEINQGYCGIEAVLANSDEISSDIYQIIIKCATNYQTGQLSEPVSLQYLKYKAVAKGYTKQ